MQEVENVNRKLGTEVSIIGLELVGLRKGTYEDRQGVENVEQPFVCECVASRAVTSIESDEGELCALSVSQGNTPESNKPKKTHRLYDRANER